MSTYVVRFVGTAPGSFRGKARHVRSGEEGIFSSPADLLCFFERMNASCCEDSDPEPPGDTALTPPEKELRESPREVAARRRPEKGSRS